MKNNHYKCIVVDPPWDLKFGGPKLSYPDQKRKLDYSTMTPPEISELPIGEWAADNSFLWLWATNGRSYSSKKPILVEAFELMEKWGFRYYTLLTWNKAQGVCPFGPYIITTEHILFGYKGKCGFSKNIMGKMKTEFYAKRGEHSEKPKLFYENIEQYFDSPRLDVFARKRHSGFDAWGNEVEEEDNEND